MPETCLYAKENNRPPPAFGVYHGGPDRVKERPKAAILDVIAAAKSSRGGAA